MQSFCQASHTATFTSHQKGPKPVLRDLFLDPTHVSYKVKAGFHIP